MFSRRRQPERELPTWFADLLTALLCPVYSDEERILIDRIEERRSSLLQSNDPITYVEIASTTDDAQNRVRVKTVGEICRISKSPRWAPLLIRVISECEPTRCLEMGAAVGISAAYQAAGLKLNGAGRLTVIEGAESFASVATETLTVLGLDDYVEVVVGNFDERLPQMLSDRGPFDYIFLDGQHTYEATMRFFQLFKDGVADPALIVFDDIDWVDTGMDQAWNEIANDESVVAAIHLGPMGFCILGSAPRMSFTPISMTPRTGSL